MKIILIQHIYDRIVSKRNCTNVFYKGSPVATNDRAFFMPVVQSKGVYMMKFLLAMIIIRFLFSILDNTSDEYEDVEENENVRIIHPAEFLTR